MFKYLITGGAGFIGSHLAERLLDDGHAVSIIDDLSTGSVSNVKHLLKNPRFHPVYDSVTNLAELRPLVDEATHVFHLAAAVGVRKIVESPVNTIERNINGTEVVLKTADVKKKPVLIASTSEVYGKSVELPYQEDQDLVLGNSTIGRWSYACSKLVDEFLGIAYYNERRSPVVIARLFNTVGPRQTGEYGMVVPRFVEAALRNEPLEVHGDGTQTRSFCHVLDVVEGLVRLVHHDGAQGQVYNLGNPEEISIAALARRVVERLGSRSPIVLVPYEEAYGKGFEDMRRRVPSIAKAAAQLGFRPRRSLDDVIDDVARYFQAKHGLPRLSETTTPG